MGSELAIKKIIQKIFIIRSLKVMIDVDLAQLYEVDTRALNRSVRRNANRFPDDFMFQVTIEEFEILKCQIGTSRLMHAPSSWGGRRKLPLVFTEQGVAMLSSVLRSERAVSVNIEIMRTFVQLRAFLLTNKELAQKLSSLEKKYDAQFKVVFDTIRQMMATPENPKRRIGIKPD